MIRLAALAIIAVCLSAQVYSPSVLRRNQPDSTDLKRFAQTIYDNAHATTPRERAEAIWRFFLTDGRFVKPGFWYHIAGWAYEEPAGEVLDPMKLLNSYGFGLCYHIAPLLEAVFEAGGFEDARVWFLTGHTVAEVFYEGAYHYFDSDMMGYNVAGSGGYRGKAVACVRQLEREPGILLDKLAGPKEVRKDSVDSPWYPADVRAGAIDGLASLFSSTKDNYLFPETRYSTGHSMDYVLRPGEKIIRYFKPEEPGLFYLPYVLERGQWREFPVEISRYNIRTEDGPRSQKDNRLWSTGRIEYSIKSALSDRITIVDMPSPWVVIDAHFTVDARLTSANSILHFETSTDDGSSWQPAGEIHGPFAGSWRAEPSVIHRSEHGRLTAVSGKYGYKVRITRSDDDVDVRNLLLTTRFQVNPRTLPALEPGDNALVYRSGSALMTQNRSIGLESLASSSLRIVDENSQKLLCPASDKEGEAVLRLSGIKGFGFGARFVDVSKGLAPDKLTAETRRTAVSTKPGTASIEWSPSADGPWHKLWSLPQRPVWRDRDPVERTLNWPEAFVGISELPDGTASAYVRVQSSGPCIDNIRLSELRQSGRPAGTLKITHTWLEEGARKQHVQNLDATNPAQGYQVKAGKSVENVAVSFELLP